MKKLNLLIALLIIGLSAQAQMTKKTDNWKTVHEVKNVFYIQSVEFTTHTQYVLFFYNQKYKSIIDIKSIGFGDLAEMKDFFAACLDVTTDKEARYSDSQASISNIHKNNAFITLNSGLGYFILNAPQITKAIEAINTLEKD
jgi:hypothetical protein